MPFSHNMIRSRWTQGRRLCAFTWNGVGVLAVAWLSLQGAAWGGEAYQQRGYSSQPSTQPAPLPDANVSNSSGSPWPARDNERLYSGGRSFPPPSGGGRRPYDSGAAYSSGGYSSGGYSSDGYSSGANSRDGKGESAYPPRRPVGDGERPWGEVPPNYQNGRDGSPQDARRGGYAPYDDAPMSDPRGRSSGAPPYSYPYRGESEGRGVERPNGYGAGDYRSPDPGYGYGNREGYGDYRGEPRGGYSSGGYRGDPRGEGDYPGDYRGEYDYRGDPRGTYRGDDPGDYRRDYRGGARGEYRGDYTPAPSSPYDDPRDYGRSYRPDDGERGYSRPSSDPWALPEDAIPGYMDWWRNRRSNDNRFW